VTKDVPQLSTSDLSDAMNDGGPAKNPVQTFTNALLPGENDIDWISLLSVHSSFYDTNQWITDTDWLNSFQ